MCYGSASGRNPIFQSGAESGTCCQIWLIWIWNTILSWCLNYFISVSYPHRSQYGSGSSILGQISSSTRSGSGFFTTKMSETILQNFSSIFFLNLLLRTFLKLSGSNENKMIFSKMVNALFSLYVFCVWIGSRSGICIPYMNLDPGEPFNTDPHGSRSETLCFFTD